MSLYRKAKSYESAGAWAIEMELVPVEVADFITRNKTIITKGSCTKLPEDGTR